jgi:phosphatidate cytidylyltransferase
MTPTRHGDHNTLLWLFFVITPIQYGLVTTEWYVMDRIDSPCFSAPVFFHLTRYFFT